MTEEIKVLVTKFSELLKKGTRYIASASEEDLKHKTSPNSWSKQEILGHLIDSGLYNLRRFSEVQFEKQPYKIHQYNQDECVKANRYNEADPLELLSFWLSTNERIIQLVTKQNEEVFQYQIELIDGKICDFTFFFTDYVVHLEHHINQIVALVSRDFIS